MKLILSMEGMVQQVEDQKNRLMVYLSAAALVINIFIFVLNRVYPFQYGMHGTHAMLTNFLSWGQIILCIIPICTFGIASYVFRRNPKSEILPWVNTLTLTFSSISMVSGSGGGIEFHFSIFMVIAATAYYEDIRLISTMTILFAIQHLVGFFFVPQLVFGTDEYPFVMLVIHAVFLLLTSGATCLQIISKQKITKQLEEDKRIKDERISRMLDHAHLVASEISETIDTISTISETNVSMNHEMRISFEQVSSGLGDQNSALEGMQESIKNIHGFIQSVLLSSEEMKNNAGNTEQIVVSNHQNIHDLKMQLLQNDKDMNSVVSTMQELKQSLERAQSIVASIHQVADQTNLLALNASIEAARAGEHGNGFSVVASEIRKLANESARAAKEIQGIMDVIMGESNETATVIESGQRTLKHSVAQAETCAKGFDQVGRTIDQLLSYIRETNRMMVSIQQDSSEVNSRMTQISAVIQEGSAAMEEVSSNCERQISSAEKIDAEIEVLSRLRYSLQEGFIEGRDRKELFVNQ